MSAPKPAARTDVLAESERSGGVLVLQCRDSVMVTFPALNERKRSPTPMATIRAAKDTVLTEETNGVRVELLGDEGSVTMLVAWSEVRWLVRG